MHALGVDVRLGGADHVRLAEGGDVLLGLHLRDVLKGIDGRIAMACLFLEDLLCFLEPLGLATALLGGGYPFPIAQ